MIERKFFLILAVLSASVSVTAPVLADEALDELMRSPEYGNVHDSMRDQKKTLTDIQDGFLANDAHAVQNAANKLAKNMRYVSQSLPEQTAADSEAWKAMYQIVAEAQALKEDVAAEDYLKAHERYSVIIGQCVRCHNLTFPQPQPAEPASNEGSIS